MDAASIITFIAKSLRYEDYKRRYLRFMGYEVNYVRNFTDVDDKIIARADQLGEDPNSLSRRFCEEFHRDMEFLHCLPPTVEPRVSDHMPQIIDMIKQVKRLEEKVVAMISDYENGYLSNLELLKIIDSIERLGFGYRFQINIRVLDKIAKISENNLGIEEIEDDLHVVSLNFRLLQQHHYNVSQDISSL